MPKKFQYHMKPGFVRVSFSFWSLLKKSLFATCNVPLSRQEAQDAAERSVKTDAFWQKSIQSLKPGQLLLILSVFTARFILCIVVT